MAKSNSEWKPITDPSFKPSWYYDFKLKDGSVVFGGMYKNGKYGDRYGIPISRPLYFKEHRTYRIKA